MKLLPVTGKFNNLLPSTENGFFPIRTVAEATGVNPITLRAWERRYNLITPQRTPKGHRLYTQKDIDRIHQVTALLNKGISISQVKPLLDRTATPAIEFEDSSSSQVWERYLEIMLAAIAAFDEHRLDNAYNDALSLYPIDIISTRLITPILEKLGENWDSNAAGIAEEHFFSVYLRNKLGARIQHMSQRANGPSLLLACLPDEQHDAGLLLFALAALNYGYRTIILGANLPLTQIPPVLAKRSCDAIVLSGFSAATDKLAESELRTLVRNTSIPVFIGGTFNHDHQTVIKSTGAIYAGKDIHAGLEKIAEVLTNSHPLQQ